MGKYMPKPKKTREVAIMDVSHSYLGVRTRAKTLALQRLHQSTQPPPPSKHDYLELRSRRLEKPQLLKHNCREAPKQGFVCTDEGNTSKTGNPCYTSGFPIERQIEGFETGDSEIEASLGENILDSEARESRCTRESTPCSMIRPADTITTPGSSTKRRPSVVNQRIHNVLRNTPTACEMEEFFSHAEQPQQRHFIEKYNFDIVNDLPLHGRYEWVRVMP